MRPRYSNNGTYNAKRTTKSKVPTNYQNLILGPRDPSSNGTQPKLDQSQLSLTAEGIAYKLIDPVDEDRYYVLGDNGI